MHIASFRVLYIRMCLCTLPPILAGLPMGLLWLSEPRSDSINSHIIERIGDFVFFRSLTEVAQKYRCRLVQHYHPYLAMEEPASQIHFGEAILL